MNATFTRRAGWRRRRTARADRQRLLERPSKRIAGRVREESAIGSGRPRRAPGRARRRTARSPRPPGSAPRRRRGRPRRKRPPSWRSAAEGATGAPLAGVAVGHAVVRADLDGLVALPVQAAARQAGAGQQQLRSMLMPLVTAGSAIALATIRSSSSGTSAFRSSRRSRQGPVQDAIRRCAAGHVAGEGLAPGDHLVEVEPEREDIAPGVESSSRACSGDM